MASSLYRRCRSPARRHRHLEVQDQAVRVAVGKAFPRRVGAQVVAHVRPPQVPVVPPRQVVDRRQPPRNGVLDRHPTSLSCGRRGRRGDITRFPPFCLPTSCPPPPRPLFLFVIPHHRTRLPSLRSSSHMGGGTPSGSHTLPSVSRGSVFAGRRAPPRSRCRPHGFARTASNGRAERRNRPSGVARRSSGSREGTKRPLTAPCCGVPGGPQRRGIAVCPEAAGRVRAADSARQRTPMPRGPDRPVNASWKGPRRVALNVPVNCWTPAKWDELPTFGPCYGCCATTLRGSAPPDRRRCGPQANFRNRPMRAVHCPQGVGRTPRGFAAGRRGFQESAYWN